MLFTATTVLDTRANVEHFVRANLAMGVDHMVVFLDAPKAEGQQEVREWLESCDHVTAVPTGRSWWQGDRPRSLNVRQRINANLVVEMLSDLAWASWVFHLDGDEVFAGDRAVLDALPASTAAAWLAPLEAVSEPEPASRPTLFKRLLDEADLNLLHVLGVLDAPTNGSYFHGHVMGKSGVRPSAGLRLTLHEAIDGDGRRAPRAEHPALSVLHYDAISGAEFVRKWTAMLGAGPARFRPDRAPVAEALRALVGKDLEPAVAQRHLRLIYERTTADDVSTLAELGLLVQVDPTTGTHAPPALTGDQRSQLAEALERLGSEPKRRFHAEKSPGPGSADHSPGQPDALRSRLSQAVGRRRRDG